MILVLHIEIHFAPILNRSRSNLVLKYQALGSSL